MKGSGTRHWEASQWIRQTATASNVQIVPPRPRVRIGGVTVTPDGNFVDFVTLDPTARVQSRCGAWRVIDEVYSPVAWSADGS